MEKNPIWRQQNPDGSVTTFFEDGSFVKVDVRTGAVLAQDGSPNPQRAAALRSGSTAREKAVQDTASTEDARRWNATSKQLDRGYDQKADEIANNYRVTMMGARTNQEQQQATARYQQDQSQLARERLAFDRETQGQNLGMQQANLGYDLIKTGAQMGGPSDYFAANEYFRGVSGNPNTSTFLGALQNNTRMADYGAQGGVPQAESLGTLSQKLQGGGNQNAGNYLSQIGNVAAKGAQQLGAGTLEQLTPTEMKLFTGGLSKLGYDPDTFLAQHARSRIGQGFNAAGRA